MNLKLIAIAAVLILAAAPGCASQSQQYADWLAPMVNDVNRKVAAANNVEANGASPYRLLMDLSAAASNAHNEVAANPPPEKHQKSFAVLLLWMKEYRDGSALMAEGMVKSDETLYDRGESLMRQGNSDRLIWAELFKYGKGE